MPRVNSKGTKPNDDPANLAQLAEELTTIASALEQLARRLSNSALRLLHSYESGTCYSFDGFLEKRREAALKNCR